MKRRRECLIEESASVKNFLTPSESALSRKACAPQPCGYSSRNQTAPTEAVPKVVSAERRESSEQKNRDTSANAAHPSTNATSPCCDNSPMRARTVRSSSRALDASHNSATVHTRLSASVRRTSSAAAAKRQRRFMH